jgi:hypothetical protein
MRKRLLVLALLLLAAAVAVPLAVQQDALHQKWARGHLIDWKHCDRIQKGMTRVEVEAILGGPPGDYRTQMVVYHDWSGWLLEEPDPRNSWIADSGYINVRFDSATDRVPDTWFEGPVPLGEPSLAERVRAWLRRVWP